MVAIQLYGISCSYLFNKRDAQSMFKQQFLQNDSILSLTVQVDGEVFRVDPTLHALYTTTVYSRQLKFSSVQFFFFEFSLIQNFSQGFRQSPGIRITENRLQIKNMLWSVSCLKGSYSIVLELWRQNNGVQIGVGVYAGLLQQLYIDNQQELLQFLRFLWEFGFNLSRKSRNFLIGKFKMFYTVLFFVSGQFYQILFLLTGQCKM
eukprot:TRINITY_DN9757_c0_g1_i2.p1 TRINITY_DN9757_c0_g1~~TRINITY_DN9757_c0_g1_i2.p1  ORF type:complete len:205 (-),score=-14.08 TRINITY_DN9757_c0_g1_i2:99-713(-)